MRSYRPVWQSVLTGSGLLPVYLVVVSLVWIQQVNKAWCSSITEDTLATKDICSYQKQYHDEHAAAIAEYQSAYWQKQKETLLAAQADAADAAGMLVAPRQHCPPLPRRPPRTPRPPGPRQLAPPYRAHRAENTKTRPKPQSF